MITKKNIDHVLFDVFLYTELLSANADNPERLAAINQTLKGYLNGLAVHSPSFRFYNTNGKLFTARQSGTQETVLENGPAKGEMIDMFLPLRATAIEQAQFNSKRHTHKLSELVDIFAGKPNELFLSLYILLRHAVKVNHAYSNKSKSQPELTDAQGNTVASMYAVAEFHNPTNRIFVDNTASENIKNELLNKTSLFQLAGDERKHLLNCFDSKVKSDLMVANGRLAIQWAIFSIVTGVSVFGFGAFMAASAVREMEDVPWHWMDDDEISVTALSISYFGSILIMVLGVFIGFAIALQAEKGYKDRPEKGAETMVRSDALSVLINSPQDISMRRESSTSEVTQATTVRKAFIALYTREVNATVPEPEVINSTALVLS